MRFRALIVGGGRLQSFVIAIALICAVLFLALATGARGESAAQPRVDDGPEDAPYAAGELLVAYEPGTPEKAQSAVVRQSGARTLEDLPGEVRLISFPEITHEASEAARERALARELRDLGHIAGVEVVDYNYLRRPFFMPNDPRLDDQWGLTKTRFPGAWNDSRGAGAKVAIVDSGVNRELATGVYQKHPDIGRIAAQYDFVEGNALADDDYGHGTRVTGIAGALTDNGKGVAGGCFKCGLLIAKVMDANGSATDSRIIAGIDWSLDHGADVVNLSLGGPEDSSFLEDAVNDAYARGAVVVAAAGNTGTIQPQYPAAYPKAIAVSATDRGDGLAYFSSRGDWVDLAAPGTSILSTRVSGDYGAQSGTSMSAPFVSGLAGLLVSQNPDRSPYWIRQRMQDTAVDLGSAGHDPRFGYGRIDADKAVR